MKDVEALSEALDDAITMARVNHTLEDTDAIAAQTITVLAQFGWVLECTQEDDGSVQAEAIPVVDVFSIALGSDDDV